MDRSVIFETRGLCKAFGSTKANTDISFSLERGEIRGLAGENGSGKSTLLSQIAGLYPPDSGEMLLKGKPYAPKSTLDAGDAGIGMVVQELGVIGCLSAQVNVFLGHTEKYSKAGLLSFRRMNADINALCEKYGIGKIPLSRNTGQMDVESRKVVELLRALALDPEILILDEVTQALSLNNRKVLYRIIERFKNEGKSVILISHDLEELIEITDSLTVLRDGKVVDTVKSAEVTADDLKKLMVGRELEGSFYRADSTPSRMEDVVLEAKGVTVEGSLNDVSFDIHEGEIVALCGLSDSGIHKMGEALYGLIPGMSGEVWLKKRNIKIDNPQTALKNKMAYVPKERDGEGLMLKTTIRDNMALPSAGELKGRAGFLSKKKRNMLALKAKDEYSVKCNGIFQKVESLSGGNKQKINLGRWMMKDLELLILDCPTRGVDVAVKAYIYQLIEKAKKAGLAILMISDEIVEAIGMADRILVCRKGSIVREIERGPEFSEENIIEVMI